MKVPPWACYTAEEQKAFAEFVMWKLDEMDMAEANAPVPEGFTDHMETEAAKASAIKAARDAGLIVQPSPNPRGRPKSDIDALDCAIRDVGRMREIFRRYWGKSNRYTRPTRTAIAAKYWELSKEDADALERHFSKVKKAGK